jgi:hypothetical protein
MDKELVFELNRQADELELKAKEAEQVLLNSSDEEYDEKKRILRDLQRQVMKLRKQALAETML